MTRRLPALLCATALLAGLTACSSDSRLNSTSVAGDFRHDDPPGFIACRDLGLAEAAGGEEDRERLLESAAAAAAAAQSVEIRRTVTPPVDGEDGERVGTGGLGQYTVEEADLHAACEEVGFDFALTSAEG